MFSKGSQQDSFKRSLPSTHEERKTETDSTAPRRGWQAWDLFPLSLLLKVCSNLHSPTNSLSKPTLFPRSYSLLKAGCHSSALHHSGTLVSKLGCILSEQGSGPLENQQEDKCMEPHTVTPQTLDSSSLSTKWSPQAQGQGRDKD